MENVQSVQWEVTKNISFRFERALGNNNAEIFLNRGNSKLLSAYRFESINIKRMIILIMGTKNTR